MRFQLNKTVAGISCALVGWGGVSAFAQNPPQPAPLYHQDEKEPGKSKPARDRWGVKTGSDPDAAIVARKPVKTTVEKLLAMPRPESLPLSGPAPSVFQDHRLRPVETTVWAVEADITEFRAMPDGDYRVVIRGASGQTMTLEMPNPAPETVKPGSRFVKDIAKARQQFEAKMSPAKGVKPEAAHALITGIGFFGRSYRPDAAVTGNLIQLHPVLNIQWLARPTSSFRK